MPDTTQDIVFKWTALPGRVTAAFLAGAAVFVLSERLAPEMRVLLAYDLTIAVYLAFMFVRMMWADGVATRDLSEKRETSQTVVLALAAILSVCSLVGVGIMLQRSKLWIPWMTNLYVGLALLAVFLSWALQHVVFGIHYARLYYRLTPPAGEPIDRPRLEFPTDELPDFLDFMYFAFTLAVCYQVSDVTICSRQIRRVALTHMLLSFFNVTLILGLVVEIVGTII